MSALSSLGGVLHKKHMTPGEWIILLHVHTTPVSLDDCMPDTDWRTGVVKRFVKEGLIEPCEKRKEVACSGYTTTARGVAYVNAICNLPFPECKWEIPA